NYDAIFEIDEEDDEEEEGEDVPDNDDVEGNGGVVGDYEHGDYEGQDVGHEYEEQDEEDEVEVRYQTRMNPIAEEDYAHPQERYYRERRASAGSGRSREYDNWQPRERRSSAFEEDFGRTGGGSGGRGRDDQAVPQVDAAKYMSPGVPSGGPNIPGVGGATAAGVGLGALGAGASPGVVPAGGVPAGAVGSVAGATAGQGVIPGNVTLGGVGGPASNANAAGRNVGLNALQEIEEAYNKRLDTDLSTLMESFGDIVKVAKITYDDSSVSKDKYKLAQESYQIQGRAMNIVSSAESLLAMVTELKQTLLLNDAGMLAELTLRRQQELTMQKTAVKQRVLGLKEEVDRTIWELEQSIYGVRPSATEATTEAGKSGLSRTTLEAVKPEESKSSVGGSSTITFTGSSISQQQQPAPPPV
ncbi:Mediator of RNA polymerase II transcription subunit 22, partial [Lunasporangiospora selenospora]